MKEVDDDHPDYQRKRRQNLKVNERDKTDASYFFDILHAANPGDNRAKNNRRNQHFDEFDESVAEWFKRSGKGGEEVSGNDS